MGRHGDGGSGEDPSQRGLGPRLLEYGPTLKAKILFYRFKKRDCNGQLSILGHWLWQMGEEGAGGGGPQGDLRGVCCKAGAWMFRPLGVTSTPERRFKNVCVHRRVQQLHPARTAV